VDTNPEVVELIKRALLWAGGAILVAVIVTLLAGCPSRSPAGMAIIKVDIEGHPLKAEVAATTEQRTRGLMYRRELGRNAGMLFAYENPSALSFWMKNTFIPLSIAFIADDGSIVHITDMAPQTLAPHRSPKPVRYALEVNRGWFEDRNISAGDRAEFTLPDKIR
jgi:uncharacterized membrane protein (UPF0127 family)